MHRGAPPVSGAPLRAGARSRPRTEPDRAELGRPRRLFRPVYAQQRPKERRREHRYEVDLRRANHVRLGYYLSTLFIIYLIYLKTRI